VVKEERKRKAEEDVGVGKYLGKVGGKGEVKEAVEFGLDKKKKKAGGFGDFSGW
jgi:peptidyl-prolyl cis-trans isomerase-like protein 2